MGKPLVSPFPNVRGASAADQLNSILSTEIACRLRDVGWDPSQKALLGQLPASGARHTCLSGHPTVLITLLRIRSA